MLMGNDTIIEGKEHLERAMTRDQGQPLITVSNHVASIDDPLVVASLIPMKNMFEPSNVR